MLGPDLVVRSRRVVAERGLRAAAIHIRHGKIVGVLDHDHVPGDCPVDDVGTAAVMPGVVDIRVDPNGDIDALTRAAAAGGVTTVVDASACATRIVRAALPPSKKSFSWWPRSYAAYLEAHPKSFETDAVAAVLDACRVSRTPTHLVQLSSSDALAPLFHARAAQVPVSASTCPHYLYFVAEEISGLGLRFRCVPPIRGRENRELLWAAVANGLVHAITSGGPTPVELSLPVTWTVAHGRGCTLEQLSRWMCWVPAQLAGLTRKGRIDVGYDADLVVFNPDEEFTAEETPGRNDRQALPYAGRRLRGVVERTYVGGAAIFTRRWLDIDKRQR
jgi:dihydroorotase-like cyclic amidohydrolase